MAPFGGTPPATTESGRDTAPTARTSTWPTLKAGRESCLEVRPEVAGEERGLEEQQARRPDGGGASEQGEHQAPDHGPNEEEQAGAEADGGCEETLMGRAGVRETLAVVNSVIAPG
jgi:hypothetical protein